MLDRDATESIAVVIRTESLPKLVELRHGRPLTLIVIRVVAASSDLPLLGRCNVARTALLGSGSNSGYRGVCYCPKQKGCKKYKLRVRVGGKLVSLGYFATAE